MVASVATSGMGTTLKRGDGGVGAGTQASKTFGTSNQQLKILAHIAGTAGNSKTAAVIVSGTASYSQTVTQNTLSITSASSSGTATTTVAEAIAALYADETFRRYWDANTGTGTGTGVLVAGASGALSGGLAGTEAFTALSEVRNIEGPTRSQSPIDVTHMGSPNYYREYIAGMLDAGEVTFDMNFINDSEQTGLITDLEDRTERNFQLVFTTDDGDITWQFNAIVLSISNSFQMEQAISANVTLRLNGGVTDVTP